MSDCGIGMIVVTLMGFFSGLCVGWLLRKGDDDDHT